MRHRHAASWLRCSSGFSLIELMVSLTIGLVVAMAAFSAYLGASSASKMADAQSRMNEDAQAALVILAQQLKMAGNNPDRADRVDDDDASVSSRRNPVYGPTTFATGTFTTSGFSIRGCDGRFDNLMSAKDLDALHCAVDSNTQPDSLAVNYEADAFNTIAAPPASGKSPTDCLGKKLAAITATLTVVSGTGTATATTSYFVADNRFYIGTAAPTSSPGLFCKGNGESSTAQALVENVEDMQFTYGAVNPGTTSTGATVAGYLRADQLVASIPSSSDSERWGKVLVVRICVLVRSEGQVLPDSTSARYLNCEGLLAATPTDHRLRKAYFATVVLRNRRL